MKPVQRQQQLLNRLRAVEREWRVDELAAALKVSPQCAGAACGPSARDAG